MAYNILIVDDSEIVRGIVKRSISMSGLDVGNIMEAGDGLEALDVLSKEWVDIVFADLNMPNMNGEELVEKMSDDNLLVSVPVVIVSSDHSEDRIKELKERGIRAYMKKPFRPENLLEVAGKILGQATEEAK